MKTRRMETRIRRTLRSEKRNPVKIWRKNDRSQVFARAPEGHVDYSTPDIMVIPEAKAPHSQCHNHR